MEFKLELVAVPVSDVDRAKAFYTDKAGMFQAAVKTKRQEQREGRDRVEMPPTQIARALRELGIVWIPAHSPQAKGRVERQFLTAQDRLVKGLRVADVRTIEDAPTSMIASSLNPAPNRIGTRATCKRLR